MFVKVAAFAIRFFCASHSASTLAWACMIGGYRYQSIFHSPQYARGLTN